MYKTTVIKLMNHVLEEIKRWLVLLKQYNKLKLVKENESNSQALNSPSTFCPPYPDTSFLALNSQPKNKSCKFSYDYKINLDQEMNLNMPNIMFISI